MDLAVMSMGTMPGMAVKARRCGYSVGCWYRDFRDGL